MFNFIISHAEIGVYLGLTAPLPQLWHRLDRTKVFARATRLPWQWKVKHTSSFQMQHHNLLAWRPNILQIQNTQHFTFSSAEAQFRYRGLFLLPDCESIRSEEYALFIEEVHLNKTIATSTSTVTASTKPQTLNLRLEQYFQLFLSQLATTTVLSLVR